MALYLTVVILRVCLHQHCLILALLVFWTDHSLVRVGGGKLSRVLQNV